MGIYRITNGVVGKALPLTTAGGAGVANISDVPVSSSAWLFENQSGTLGTNLNGSVIYVGGAGDITVILSGIEGVANKVTFASAPVGAILPVAVDYVLATGTTATGLVACK